MRARGVELLGRVDGSGYDRAPALVRRADGQTVQLTPLLFQLLESIDGRRGYDELASALEERTDRLVTADDVRFLVETKLAPLGVLRDPGGAEPELEAPNPLLALNLKYVVSDPAVTNRLATPFAVLFHPALVVAFTAAFAIVIAWIVAEKGLASAFHQAIYEPALLLVVLGLTVLSAAFHELGHAAACRYSGARPGAMGVGLYLVWPAFYTDVSDSYRLDRRSRLRVDLGGLYFNAIFAVAAVGACLAVGWDALLLVVAAQVYLMVRQLVPIVRFDGYHVLADLVGVPDLFRHIKPTLLSALGRGRSTSVRLRPWARAVVTTWVLAVVPLLAAMLLFVILLLPRIVATAIDSIGLHWERVSADSSSGEVTAVASGAVSMLLVALPLIGIPYLVGRVVSRAGRFAWSSTDGRPAGRGIVLVAGALGVAALAWLWWPEEQYRPLEPTERWGLASSVRSLPQIPSALTSVSGAPATPEPTRAYLVALVTTQPDGTAGPVFVVAPGLDPADVGDEAAAAVTTTTTNEALPAETTPTSESSGATGTNAPVPAPAPAPAPSVQPPAANDWPFPFRRPRQPEPGDNQVVVVNTRDNTLRYSQSLSFVWVTGGDPVDQWNEAWALASCTNCKTVAIAFQVVLSVGSSPVVTPVNVAVAVNHECNSCITHALALQLVATLTSQPDPQTLAKLKALWEALVTASEGFYKLSLTEINAQLAAAQAQILQILTKYVAVEGAAPDTVSTSTATATATTSTATTPSTADTETTTSPTTTTSSTTAPASQPEPPTATTTTTTPASAEVTTPTSPEEPSATTTTP